MMKAVVLDKFGDASKMYIKEDVPIPEISEGEVLVRVQATAINRADTLQRKGLYPNPPGSSPILGLECSGYVEKVSPGIDDFKVGDPVMCLLAGGGYAGYVAVPVGQCMPKPESMSVRSAAAIPETWLTGYQLLHQLAKVQRGEYVLIHAGAAGVGSALIQMCALVGAKAIVTAGSQEKLEHCSRLGAVFGANYKDEGGFADKVKEFVTQDSQGAKTGVDIVLDCVGASHAPQNMDVLGTDSRWVLYGLMGGRELNSFNLGMILRKRIQLMGTTLRARSLEYKAQLVAGFSRDVLPHFDGGSIKEIIDCVLPLDQVSQAHERMEANLNKGKIVLYLSESD